MKFSIFNFQFSISRRGVTLTESIVTIGIIIILLSISVPAFLFFQRRSELDNSLEEIINVLRTGQSKTLASEEASQYGVYFDITTLPHQYTLFKGQNFSSRDTSFDKVYKLPNRIEIYQINLAGGNEVVFRRITGEASPEGNLSLRLISEPTISRTIYIKNSGQVGLTLPATPSDGERIKDSRHVHFDYSRLNVATNETLTLDFTTTTETILISDNLKDGQIYWEGRVLVDGQEQKLKIQTHRFNAPDSQFSIQRDRRYNNKALTITISGDGSGSLIEYSVDGLTTNFNSIYVSNLIWQ